MSTFLNVLLWVAGGFSLAATVLTLTRLTVGDLAHGKAKPGARAAAWRMLCYTAGLTLNSASQLVMNGISAWVTIGLALGLIGFAFIWELRLQFRPARPAGTA